MRKLHLSSCIRAALVANMVGLSGIALAQDAAPEKEAKAKNIEKIVVTGSNIRRSNIDVQTSSPIQVMGIEAIEASGAGQVQDLFKNLSVNSGSEMSTSQNSRQGLSQFSLRGLGVSGTLTLVNGRRAGLSAVAS
ncbi:MAG: TonB-dependent receptor plug domain-containing protein, partial [Paraglaciecola sp.]|nr:TonB-dependent receptor plug domain-containing protein [Paraglaciecola sp.]